MRMNDRVNLRGRRALVLHPSDNELRELCGQLSRIGLSVSCVSPRIVGSLSGEDFVFVSLSDDWEPPTNFDLQVAFGQAVRIVVLENESPTVLGKLMAFEADAVIVKPFRPIGLFAVLVHALQKRSAEANLRNTVRRLELKLAGVRDVEKAKGIIAERHGITPPEAYALLRQAAMNERTTVERIASTIIEAERVLPQALPSHTRVALSKG